MQNISEQEEESLRQFKRHQQRHAKMIRRQTREQIFRVTRKVKEQQRESNEVLSIQPLIIQSRELKPLKKKLIVDSQLANQIEEIMDQIITTDMFDQFCQILLGKSNSLDLHWAIIGMRRLFCQPYSEKQFNQKIAQTNLISILLSYMSKDNYPQLKLQAAWILTNLAAWSQQNCCKIVQNNGLQIFSNVLQQNQEGIIDQVIWGIGNLAGDSTKWRDVLISFKVVDTLTKIGTNSIQINKKLMCASTLSNLLRGHPLPQFQLIKDGVIFICNFVRDYTIKDDDSMYDLLCTLAYNIKGGEKIIQQFIDTKAISKIIQLATIYIDQNKEKLLQQCLKIFGNIIMGNRAQTAYVVNQGIIEILQGTIGHSKKKIRKDICWMISNIVAQSIEITQQIIKNQNLLRKLRQLFESDSLTVAIEICYIYNNLALNITSQCFIKIMIKQKVLQRLIQMIKDTDEGASLQGPLKLLYTFIQKAQNIQKYSKSENQIELQILNYDGALSRLHELSNHKNQKIRTQVDNIIQKFCKSMPIIL